MRVMRHWLERKRLKSGKTTASAWAATVVTLVVLLLTAFSLQRPPPKIVTPEHYAAVYDQRQHQSPHFASHTIYNHTQTQLALTERFVLPPAVSAMLPDSQAARLMDKLEFATKLHHEPARLLIIHVQNGLGNRLRALSSGLAMARATRRVPLVVWEVDAHLGARFHDVLQERVVGNVESANTPASVLYSDLVVIDKFPHWSLLSKRTRDWRPFNYMVKDGPDAHQGETLYWLVSTVACPKTWFPRFHNCRRPADTIAKRAHVYFKSAYVANVYPRHLSYSSRVNAEMRALRPVQQVVDIVNKHWPGGNRYMFGAHVRSRLVKRDGVNVDDRCEYSASAEEMTDYWRAQSSLQEFLNLLHYLLNRYKTLHFFLAADDAEALKKAGNMYPGRVHYIPRTCDDRAPECVQYALADLLSLARCSRIYGSNWSSFTEAAGRLANRRPWLSGVHFGKMKGKRHRSWSFSRMWKTLKHKLKRGWARCD